MRLFAEPKMVSFHQGTCFQDRVEQRNRSPSRYFGEDDVPYHRPSSNKPFSIPRKRHDESSQMMIRSVSISPLPYLLVRTVARNVPERRFLRARHSDRPFSGLGCSHIYD